MLINNYTISGIDSLKRFPTMDVAQFTLNSRIWPGKRKTVEALRSVKPYHKSKVLVHYDFIYILSRYAMFSQNTRKAILEELVDIMSYANHDKTIIGIVMHMDWSLKKGITDSTEDSKILDEYQGSVWNTNFLPQMIKSHYGDWLEMNISQFVNDFNSFVTPSFRPGCKIYLENTTKVGPNKEGSFTYLKWLLMNHLEWQSIFGIALDSEHMFAVDGRFPDFVKENQQLWGIDMVAHLNTIPVQVTPCSGKDLHSDNTVFECSRFKPEDYFNMVADIKSAGIPFVREVKEDTMFREIEQMKEWRAKLFQ